MGGEKLSGRYKDRFWLGEVDYCMGMGMGEKSNKGEIRTDWVW